MFDEQRTEMIWQLYHWCYQDMSPHKRLEYITVMTDEDLNAEYAQKKLEGEIKPFDD